jgi:hypothetical protein
MTIPLARSTKTIVEPKPKQDLIEEALMASLEEMVQPSFNVKHFIE